MCRCPARRAGASTHGSTHQPAAGLTGRATAQAKTPAAAAAGHTDQPDASHCASTPLRTGRNRRCHRRPRQRGISEQTRTSSTGYYETQGFEHLTTIDIPSRRSGALFQRPAVPDERIMPDPPAAGQLAFS